VTCADLVQKERRANLEWLDFRVLLAIVAFLAFEEIPDLQEKMDLLDRLA
jgi:hypothetical protein